MANIEIKRGQKTQAEVTYVAEGTTVAYDYGDGHTASLVIRRKDGNSFNGELLDTLSSEDAPATGANRIKFFSAESGEYEYVAAGPSVQLLWSTTESSALPNEAVTVYGDLKITLSSEVINSFRIPFDIIPEII